MQHVEVPEVQRLTNQLHDVPIELGLGESLACYEEGVKLLKLCYNLLEQAERKIELLSGVDAEGNAHVCGSSM